MGEWKNTACAHASVEATAAALEAIFAGEGRRAVAAPSSRPPAQYDAMQYGSGDENDLWGVAVVPVADGWSMIMTAPYEILCEPSPASGRPRLAELAIALGAEAFQHNLYDGDSTVLLECDPAGAVAVSGLYALDDDDPLRFHDLAIDEDADVAGFRLVRVPDEVQRAVERQDNAVQVEALIPRRPLEIAGGRCLYFQR